MDEGPVEGQEGVGVALGEGGGVALAQVAVGHRGTWSEPARSCLSATVGGSAQSQGRRPGYHDPVWSAMVASVGRARAPGALPASSRGVPLSTPASRVYFPRGWALGWTVYAGGGSLPSGGL